MRDNTNNIVIAIKSVNTPQTEVGAVLSYTITISNQTDSTLTQVRVRDLIDKSLEVERNSIGINGVVSTEQTLDLLVLPDLLPYAQHEVVFNTILKRMPQNTEQTLHEKAEIYYTYNDEAYTKETSVATTSVADLPLQVSYLNMVLAVDKENAAIGEEITFCLTIAPYCYVICEQLRLSIELDRALAFLPNSLYINATNSNYRLVDIVLPPIKPSQKALGDTIIVSFKAQVIEQPNKIRPLTSTVAVLQYRIEGYCYPIRQVSNEALVEVLPPVLWGNQLIQIPLAGLGINREVNPQVSIGRKTMVSCGELLQFNLCYEVLVQEQLGNEERVRYSFLENFPVYYPYTTHSTIYVWAANQKYSCKGDKLEVMVNILIQG